MPESKRRQPFLTAFAVAAAKRWKITLVLWALLLVAGGFAFSRGLAREGFPAIDVPMVVVEGVYFGDNAEVVDAEVSEPLSLALLQVEGLKSLATFTRSNGFFMLAEFEDGYTSTQGAAALAAAGPAATPAEAQVQYRATEAIKYLETYDILVSVVAADTTAGTADPATLEARAREVVTHLEKNPDIERVEIQELLTAGTDPSSGEEVIRQTSFSRTFGEGESEFRPSIIIGLVRGDTGLDTITFSESVRDQLATGDFDDVFITADFAVDIKAQLRSLQNNLLTGLVAVAFVSLLLIGWRAALVTSAFMITVVSAAFLALWIFGYSLNTVTLFALILTIGLLVDDAVVIAESIDANRHESDNPQEVVSVAINRVGRASLAGTLTTVLVFMPLLFVTGIIGKFIRVMPITVIITLLTSFVLSIGLISALAGAFLLKGKPSNSPIMRLEDKTASALQRLASLLEGHRVKGFILSLAGVALSLIPIAIGFSLFGSLGFNVFPPGKDSNILQMEIDFADGLEIADAEQIAATIDAETVAALGENLLGAQYIYSSSRSALVFVDLVPFSDRSTKSPELVDRLSEHLSDIDGAEIGVSQLNQGPPVSKFPFSVQIRVSDDQVEAGEVLALEMAAALEGATVTRSNGETAKIVETVVSTNGQVFRADGAREIVIRGRFDGEDVSALLAAGQELVERLYPPSLLTERGLGANALVFDFGLESENTEGFNSIIRALVVALAAMVILLMVQFRSLIQPLLIVIAIPFSFLGVGAGLSYTDNPLSFLVMIGLIGLIGVVVNNTILLTDAANQARRDGATPAEAIGLALKRRFRPLIATTITTVAGLLPLAISDPFWQPMAITIMVGLVSSTVLVLLAFPFYYRAVEYIRVWVGMVLRAIIGLFRPAGPPV